jgi:predicted ferric reductase
MSRARPTRNTWVLVLIGAVALAIAVGVELTQLAGGPLAWVIRGLALLGYQMVFLAILSSAYLPELVRFFGRPFIQVHHVLSVAGLVLVTLHPLGVAWDTLSLRVFVPRSDSLYTFLQLGGRPAWYLLALALLAALLRRAIGKSWRWVHGLNYLAFFLATVHANLIGTNFQCLVPRVGSIVMVLAVVAAFWRKRLGARRQPLAG